MTLALTISALSAVLVLGQAQAEKQTVFQLPSQTALKKPGGSRAN